MTEAELKLLNAIFDGLLFFWHNEGAPSRKKLVERIKADYPDSQREPRLDLFVGQTLNRLVDTKALKRVDGKFYHPGPMMGKPKPVTTVRPTVT